MGCEVIAASVDTPEVHLAWVNTARSAGGLGAMKIPLVSDPTRAISADYGVLITDPKDGDAGITLRGLFVIDPAGVVQQMCVVHPACVRTPRPTLRLPSLAAAAAIARASPLQQATARAVPPTLTEPSWCANCCAACACVHARLGLPVRRAAP